VFDERDPVVVTAIKSVIGVAKSKSFKIGICGQVLREYPGFAQMLVEAGIDSISLNSVAVLHTTVMICGMEEQLQSQQ
jgi:pyruvate,water dikinase